MMIKNIGDYLSLNGQVYPVHNFAFNESNSLIVYEVVRVINSVPLFLDLHLIRLRNSAKVLCLKEPSIIDILSNIRNLIDINKIPDNNLKLSLIYNTNSIDPDIMTSFIQSKYPTQLQMDEGVDVRTINATRDEPNAKIENKGLRSYADEQINLFDCYEVVLVNKQGIITEGSRSNIFFISDGKLYTPGLDKILGGITRQMVCQISKSLNIEVMEEDLPLDQLAKYECAFLTGTSPGVLPIKRINEIEYNVNNAVLIQVIRNYNLMVEKDIKSQRLLE